MYHMAVNLGVIHGHGQKPGNAPPLSLAERINQVGGGSKASRHVRVAGMNGSPTSLLPAQMCA